MTSSNSRKSIVRIDSSSSESSVFFDSDTPFAEMKKKSLLKNKMNKNKKTSPNARKEQLKDVPARRVREKIRMGKENLHQS